MGRLQAKFKPRAAVPVCWLCGKRLYAGGRSYVIVVDNGVEHPAHRTCAESDLPNPTAQPTTDESKGGR